MNLQGLQIRQQGFAPAARIFSTRNDIVRCSFLGQQQWRNLAARPGARLSFKSTTSVRLSHGSNDPVTKSGIFSFNIVDLLGFLIRIPVLILGFINKEKKVIDEIEDRLEDAAETVGDVAEVVEKVAEVVQRVAEEIADDAKETREFMDKVEATADSMRTDISSAVDSLQEAAALKAPGDGKKPASEIKAAVEAAKEATSRASEKAEKVKEAAIELEEKGAGGKPVSEIKDAVEAAKEASSRASEKAEKVKEAAIELEEKGTSQAKFQAVSRNRPMFSSVFLASIVVVLVNWWFPQLSYVVKIFSELIVPIFM